MYNYEENERIEKVVSMWLKEFNHSMSFKEHAEFIGAIMFNYNASEEKITLFVPHIHNYEFYDIEKVSGEGKIYDKYEQMLKLALDCPELKIDIYSVDGVIVSK